MKRYFGIKANKTLSIYREKAADYDAVFVFFLNLAIRSLSGFEKRTFHWPIKTKLELLPKIGKKRREAQPICYLRKPITELVLGAFRPNLMSFVNKSFRTLPNGDFHGALADSRRSGRLEVC